MLEYYSAQQVRLCPPLLKIRPCLLLLFILVFAFSASALATVFRQLHLECAYDQNIDDLAGFKIYQHGQSISTLYKHAVISLEPDVVLNKKMAKTKY